MRAGRFLITRWTCCQASSRIPLKVSLVGILAFIPSSREPSVAMSCISFFMGAAFLQGTGWVNPGSTSVLGEPLSSSLLGSTCRGPHLSPLGTWGSHRGDKSAESDCPCPWSHCAQAGTGRAGDPPNRASCLPAGPGPGKPGYNACSQFLSHFPRFFNLLASSWTSVTKPKDRLRGNNVCSFCTKRRVGFPAAKNKHLLIF